MKKFELSFGVDRVGQELDVTITESGELNAENAQRAFNTVKSAVESNDDEPETKFTANITVTNDETGITETASVNVTKATILEIVTAMQPPQEQQQNTAQPITEGQAITNDAPVGEQNKEA